MDDSGFLDRLRRTGKLTPSAARRAELASSQTATPIERTLLEFGLMAEGELFSELADFLGLPFVKDVNVDPALIRSLALTPDFLARTEVLPVHEIDETLLLATSNPRASETARSIGFHLKSPVAMAIATPSTIKSGLASMMQDTSEVEDSVSEGDLERLKTLAHDGPVIKLVNDLIAQAASEGASDIHIEAAERDVGIRFRIDGLLHSRRTVPLALQSAVVSRLKVMANLNISERRRPQDGRAQLSVRGRNIDIRLSTLPTQFGESIVLRLLDRSRVALDWDSLGFEPKLSSSIEKIIHQPNGIFLVAGPTGSGKTTTLYTALSRLNTLERKIITVEDPVEFSLPGISQVQVEPVIDLGFAQVLRAILRQDPDVIMVGEIRDAETAKIAVRAALVGRMVLSTVHTNDSLSAIPRLLDLGVPSYLLAATLRGVLSQRLVRRICMDCRGMGCGKCGDSGHAGRCVLPEMLTVGSSLTEAISGGADLAGLRATAKQDGFIELRVHAQRLLDCGEVLADDVLRAIAFGS